MTFSEDAFLAQKPGSPLQTFHKRAVHLQLFKQVSSQWGAEGGTQGKEQGGVSLGADLGGGARMSCFP